MIPQPGSVHHIYQKKSSSRFKHHILVEILNISYKILLFNLRNKKKIVI